MGVLTLERPSYRDVIVRWQFGCPVDSIMIQLQSLPGSPGLPVHWVFHVPPDILDKERRGEYKVPVQLSAGQKFVLRVCGLSIHKLEGGMLGYKCVEQMEAHFRAELTLLELIELHRRAVEFMTSRGKLRVALCQYMTRNKLETYYTNIMHNCNGIMKKYIKDNNGDAASVINGQINGLFFGTEVDKQTGLPPQRSHFGPQRLNVPARLLVTTLSNLYFADFYCNHKAHYVTLVLCRQGSAEDGFCKKRLLHVDKHNNCFLWITSAGLVYVTQNIWVEVLVTEDIDIPALLNNGAWWSKVPFAGTSRPGGIPKNRECEVCNLYPS